MEQDCGKIREDDAGLFVLPADDHWGALTTAGFTVIEDVLSEADVSGFVQQIEDELNSARPNGGVGHERTIASVSLTDRSTWPSKGRRRCVECAPLGRGVHWERLLASAKLAEVLDGLFGKDAWEMNLNSEGDPTRWWYVPVVFPEHPLIETASRPQDVVSPPSSRCVELFGWKEDFTKYGGQGCSIPPPPERWQPVNRRRVRGKGWHVDVGPGVPWQQLRSTAGDPRLGVIILLVLSDWSPGGGGTAFALGSQNWVADKLLEQGNPPQLNCSSDGSISRSASPQSAQSAGSCPEIAEIAAPGVESPGMPFDDLNRWCVDTMLELARAGKLELGTYDSRAHPKACAPGSCSRPINLEDSQGSSVEPGTKPVLSLVAKQGDIVLVHPWNIHSGTTNLRSRPRFMANGMVRIKVDSFKATGHPLIDRTVQARQQLSQQLSQ